jgi:hypothetical protein
MTADSNWSRWGPEDEQGALNLIGPDAVRRGMAAVRSGQPVSPGLPMIAGQGPRTVTASAGAAAWAPRTPTARCGTSAGGPG